MTRTIAIGDIHGCLTALDALLAAIEPTAQDVLIPVGDYIDRGPDSKGVIDRLMELKEKTKLFALLGNHEEMMLGVLDRKREPFAWLNHGGHKTMESYGFEGDLSVIPESHRAFLESLLPYYETPTHIVVHANYDPQMRMENQPPDLLRWVKISHQTPKPHFSGKHVVMGHTHHPEGQIVQLPHLTCIDTFCYGGKWLTALELESQHVWQSSPEGEVREFDLEPMPTPAN
ncbi:MAG: metallophosphoesterase [Planctomycetes bacterium]|nr:metallophosphoesterase [Planctomycetota bacterium]